MFRSTRLLPTVLAVLVLLSGANSLAAAATITWTGTAGDGLWHTAGNWDLNRTPGAGDDVVIPNLPATTSVTHGSNVTTSVNSLSCAEPFVMPTGVLNLAAASSFSSGLSLSNATIGGAGNIAITGPGFDWQTGTITGSGTLTVQAGVNWTMSGINLSSFPGLDRPLDNFGALVITQTSGMQVAGGGLFRNQSGGSVDFRSDGIIGLNGPFENLAGATFLRSTSTGTGLVQGGTFTNAGTVSVQSGALIFPFITVTSSGAMTVAPGAAVGFSGANASFPAGSSLTVNGSLQVPSFSNITLDPAMSSLMLAGVSLDAGNLSIGPNVSIGALTMDGGATIGGAGNLTVTNGFTMKGGTLSGSGTLTLPTGLNWTMPPSPSNSAPEIARTVNNDGTGVMTNNRLRISGSGLFRNRSGASFDIRTGDPTIDGSGTFENQAGATLLRTTGTGTVNLQALLTNSGTLSHQSGTLQCNFSTITNNGTVTTAGGATLQVANGTFSSTAGSSVNLNGALSIVGGTTTFPASMASLTISGAVTISAGGGTLSVGPNVTVGTLNQSGGTLTGTGTVTIGSALNWTGGIMSGTGTTIIPAGLAWSVSGSGIPDLRRTLENNGICTWDASNELQIQGGGLFRNKNGAQFLVRNNQRLITLLGTGTFENLSGALFEKANSNGTSTVQLTSFVQDGTLGVRSGNLEIPTGFQNFAGGTLTGGSYDLAATFRFPGSNITTLNTNLILDGFGVIQNLGGGGLIGNTSLNIPAGASLVLKNGAGLQVNGAITTAGDVTILNPASLAVNSGYTQTAGSTTLVGGGLLQANALINDGVFAGNGRVQGSLQSSATVSPGASPGKLTITGNYTQTSGGVLVVQLAGTNPGTDFDLLEVEGTAALDGTLDAGLVNGFTPAPDLTFDFVTAATRTGEFASSTFPLAYAGGCLELSYTPTAGRITSHQTPSFTQQPAGQNICLGGAAVFSFQVNITPPFQIQWRKNGQDIPGADQPTFTISPVGSGDAGTYSVVVANVCDGVASADAILTVRTPPTFTQNPSAQAVCPAQPASFTVAASGNPNPTFQWRKNGTDIQGATQATLNLPSVTPADAGSYDCVATNACNTVTSSAADLTVLQPVLITTQPLSATVCVGDPIALSVAATGDGLAFQWRKNTVDLSGQDGATLTIAAAQTNDSGSYDCVVGGSCGAVTSDAATVIVQVCTDPTGACCFADGSCSVVTQAGCVGAGGTYQGDNTGCDPNPCPQPPTGACCLAGGQCSVTTEAACAGTGGAYEGDLTDCVPNPCPQPPPQGACCFTGAVCFVLTESSCTAGGGTYQGDDISCDPNPCPLPPVLGACCLDGGTCIFVTESDCAESSGTYQGDNSTCTPNPCLPPPPPSGACCFATGDCFVLSADPCAQGGGLYQGDNSGCDPSPCPQPPPVTGACCFPNGSCTVLTQVACTAANGSYLGDDTRCDPNPCPQPPPIGACCFRNATCRVLAPARCELLRGAYMDNGSTCSPDPCVGQKLPEEIADAPTEQTTWGKIKASYRR